MDPQFTTYASTILRLEGAATMLDAGFAFHHLDGSWVWFAVFFLMPDLFMLGYLGGFEWGPRSTTSPIPTWYRGALDLLEAWRQ